MSTVSRHLIANLISAVCAVFTIAASWVPDRKKSYLIQVAQCFTYAVASVFFGMYATAVSMVLCSVRNGLEAYDKFSLKLCIPFCVIVAALGIGFNTSGVLGLIPAFATVVYTLGCYLCKSLLSTKINIFVNLLLWTLYDMMIVDVPSSVVDSVGALVALVAFFRIRKMQDCESDGQNTIL